MDPQGAMMNDGGGVYNFAEIWPGFQMNANATSYSLAMDPMVMDQRSNHTLSNHNNSRKRRDEDECTKGGASTSNSNGDNNDGSNVLNEGESKRLKADGSNEIRENKVDGEGKSSKATEQPVKPAEPPKQDYIHVRARRGQATDSHSLAERILHNGITMYELGPDVVRWGLHLLDVCSLTDDGSPETVTCYEKDFSHSETLGEGFCNPTHSVVENNEVIAHALQEELSRLATAEASGFAFSQEEHQNASILSQDWRDHFERFLNSVERDYQDVLPEMEDESALDGELGKRLNQMVPVSHVPKINGEIPSADEATSDHQRLLSRLQLYDLVELKISGDGNCQLAEPDKHGEGNHFDVCYRAGVIYPYESHMREGYLILLRFFEGMSIGPLLVNPRRSCN